MIKHGNTFFPDERVVDTSSKSKTASPNAGKVRTADPDTGKVKVA